MLSLIFALTTVSTVGTAEAGFPCDKFFDGGGDGVNWSDPDNWNGNTLPIPEVDNICIDLDAGDSDVVLDIDYNIGFRELLISNGDTLTVAEDKTLTTHFDTIFIFSGGKLIVRGALEASDGLVRNFGQLLVCTETGSIADGLEITGNEPEFIQCEQDVVGGTLLPIDNAVLLLAAVQSPTLWWISGLLSAVGVGAFLFTRNPNNTRNVKVILQDYLDKFVKTD